MVNPRQDHCPFTRTCKNDKVRFNPPNPRAAICYQLHDDLRRLHLIANEGDETKWLQAINELKMSLEFAKKSKG